MLKKIIFLLVVSTISLFLLQALFCLSGCKDVNLVSSSDTVYTEPLCINHLYWKNIKAEVESCSKCTTNVLDNRYKVNLYSKEYDIKGYVYVSGLGLKKGDIIVAELYTRKNDVTGEIISRQFHRFIKLYRNEEDID